MMLDIFSALVILVPLLVPVALSYGIHPVHLGILFLANMQLGYFTPPVGLNLFIASYRFNRPILELYRATLPFFFLLLGAVMIITYWPQLSLFLIQSLFTASLTGPAPGCPPAGSYLFDHRGVTTTALA